MDKALIIFVRNLQMGKVKTRMAKSMGDQEAFAAYEYMLTYTSQVAFNVDCDKYVFYSEFIEQNDPIWTPAFYRKVQEGATLGDRMSNAFKQLFATGYKEVAVIGSDNLQISADLIDTAFDLLRSTDLVVGPAADGGYYLLAAKTYYSPLFNNIPWSTAAVLEETLKVCNTAGIQFQLLPVLADIDDEEDWKTFVQTPGRRSIPI